MEAKELKEDNDQAKKDETAQETDDKTLQEAQLEWSKIRKEDEGMNYKPRGQVLQLRAEKALKEFQKELNLASVEMRQLKLELETVQLNPDAVRGMVIMAEGNVNKCTKKMEELQSLVDAEKAQLDVASKLRSQEEP